MTALGLTTTAPEQQQPPTPHTWFDFTAPRCANGAMHSRPTFRRFRHHGGTLQAGS